LNAVAEFLPQDGRRALAPCSVLSAILPVSQDIPSMTLAGTGDMPFLWRRRYCRHLAETAREIS